MTDINKEQKVLRDALDCFDCVKMMGLGRNWQKLRGEAQVRFAQKRRLAVLCGATSEIYSPLLEVCSAARGLYLELFQTPYGTWQQNILDQGSALYAFRPELALIHLTLNQLTHWPPLEASFEQVEELAKKDADEILRWCTVFHEKHAIPIFLTNFHLPPNDSLGNLSARLPSSSSAHVNRVNLILSAKAPSYVTLIDVAGLAARFGIQRWFDPVAWYHAKQPFSYDAMPVFVQSVSASLASSCLGSSKCIVLDLDHTLWGGVVADEGLDGIRLGQGNAEGEAFQDFQRYLLKLRKRGVLLAVCSKNEDSLAREVFEKHDQMLIKLSDLSGFIVNFQPKADNIRQLARDLNIGLDAMVLIDDNPVEREQMRQLAPEVKVVEISADPGSYVTALEKAFLFETTSITKEDLNRAASYSANQQRAKLATEITDIREFLRSLQMRAFLSPYLQPQLQRITQLINKSNQFNLCTVRFTLGELEAIAGDSKRITLGVRLLDCFGDNGLISAIHGLVDGQRFRIENWVMSCRVLDRGVEQVALNYLVEAARKRGCKLIEGSYRPTVKNGLVREHYQRLGFQLLQTDKDGTTNWNLDLNSFVSNPPHIQVELD
jgi:FkbH-like protein